MRFRFVTWNMNHWVNSPGDRQRSWEYLDSIGADVALLQETVPPPDYPHFVWSPIDKRNRPWGSAVISKNHDLKKVTTARTPYSKYELDLLRTWPGSVAIGKVDVGDTKPITAVSCYGLIDNGYAQTTMFRIIADLIPLFDDPTLRERVVFAGDLNISTQLKGFEQRHGIIFESIKSLGLVDCLELTKESRDPLEGCSCPESPRCAHVVTHRHRRTKSQYQNDYLFVTENLTKNLKNCSPWDQQQGFPVDENGEWVLSDHCPIVADFDL